MKRWFTVCLLALSMTAPGCAFLQDGLRSATLALTSAETQADAVPEPAFPEVENARQVVGTSKDVGQVQPFPRRLPKGGAHVESQPPLIVQLPNEIVPVVPEVLSRASETKKIAAPPTPLFAPSPADIPIAEMRRLMKPMRVEDGTRANVPILQFRVPEAWSAPALVAPIPTGGLQSGPFLDRPEPKPGPPSLQTIEIINLSPAPQAGERSKSNAVTLPPGEQSRAAVRVAHYPPLEQNDAEKRRSPMTSRRYYPKTKSSVQPLGVPPPA